jgi:hypothetical protein
MAAIEGDNRRQERHQRNREDRERKNEDRVQKVLAEVPVEAAAPGNQHARGSSVPQSIQAVREMDRHYLLAP